MTTPPEEPGTYVIETRGGVKFVVSVSEDSVWFFSGRRESWSNLHVVRYRLLNPSKFLDDTDSALLARVKPLLVELGIYSASGVASKTYFAALGELRAIGRELAK